MDRNLLVQISEQWGLPYVWLPDYEMWDLTRYISSNKAGVVYSLGLSANGFEVRFEHMDEGAVKELLQAWRHSKQKVS